MKMDEMAIGMCRIASTSIVTDRIVISYMTKNPCRALADKQLGIANSSIIMIVEINAMVIHRPRVILSIDTHTLLHDDSA